MAEKERSYNVIEAINQAFREEMQRDERVVILGEDVGKDGGIFRATKDLVEEFGTQRVIDTPVAEAGIIGASIGLAMGGMIPCPEMQFDGFSYIALYHMENHAARLRRRSQGRYRMPITLRIPYGAGVRALEHHSESREVYWAHTPGLKVVVPRGPQQAYEMLKASIRDPDPVIFHEPKALYRKFREDVPFVEEPEPLWEQHLIQEGERLTIVAWGHMLYRVRQALPKIQEKWGFAPEVIDVRILNPLDAEPIVESVKKTGRLLIVHEAPRSYGPAGEIIARVNEDALWYLEAPVERVTGYDVHTPLLAREESYIPTEGRILRGVERVMQAGPEAPTSAFAADGANGEHVRRERPARAH